MNQRFRILVLLYSFFLVSCEEAKQHHYSFGAEPPGIYYIAFGHRLNSFPITEENDTVFYHLDGPGIYYTERKLHEFYKGESFGFPDTNYVSHVRAYGIATGAQPHDYPMLHLIVCDKKDTAGCDSLFYIYEKGPPIDIYEMINSK